MNQQHSINFLFQTKFILALFFYAVSVNCYSQNKTLNLYFSDSPSEKEITLRYSILGLINYTYEPYIHRYKTDDNQLSVIIPDSITSLLMNIDSKPYYNWGKNVNLYLGEKENLTIYLDTISPPRFEGNNVGLFQFMFKLKNGTGNERRTKTLQEYLSNQSTNSFFDFIDHKIKLEVNSLDSIHQSEKTNKQFYSYAKGIIVDDYLYRAGDMGTLLNKEYLQKIDSVTFFSDIDKLYKHYTTSHLDGISTADKASLRGMNLIPKTALDLGLDHEF